MWGGGASEIPLWGRIPLANVKCNIDFSLFALPHDLQQARETRVLLCLIAHQMPPCICGFGAELELASWVLMTMPGAMNDAF